MTRCGRRESREPGGRGRGGQHHCRPEWRRSELWSPVSGFMEDRGRDLSRGGLSDVSHWQSTGGAGQSLSGRTIEQCVQSDSCC